MKTTILSFILKKILEWLCMTCRVRVINGGSVIDEALKQNKPVIFSFWHNRIFFLSYFLYRNVLRKGVPLAVLISQSKDGEFIARVVKFWGAQSARGSSSRGGLGALMSLIRRVREHYSIVTTPDGPRGPRYLFQEGTIFLSSIAQIPIIPISCTFHNPWVLNSWDRFMIPKPFSRIDVSVAEPCQIPPGIQKGEGNTENSELEFHRKRVEKILLNLAPETIQKRD